MHFSAIYVDPSLFSSSDGTKVHNEELYNFYRSPNIFRVIKSRRLRWGGHVSRMNKGSSAFKIVTTRPTTTERGL